MTLKPVGQQLEEMLNKKKKEQNFLNNIEHQIDVDYIQYLDRK